MKPHQKPSKGILARVTMSSVLGILLLSGCTKEVPYKYEVKEDVMAKAQIDTETEYLMSSSVMNISRSSDDARPFWFGDNKRVKMVWTENSLRLMETERDERFKSNAANDKLVLEIPVEHIQYECALDKYGQCTNQETQNAEVPWDKRSSVKLKLDSAKSGGLELLPLLISRTVGDNCYNEVSSRLVGYKIDQDALNFQIEKTFVTNLDCISQLNALSDATVTATFHYSVVKTSSVLDPQFRTVKYPDFDENKFGFFSTEKVVLDTDNSKTEKGIQKIMNHWNPNRTLIDYHLSDEFAKPENKTLKDLTYSTVQSLNMGLSKAGAKFQIKLHEPSGKIPGDIRHSMIVLVEDPVGSGVIGYGPQTEDPVTGQIISARTIMYLGSIKQFIKYTYDDILREKKKASRTASVNSLKLDESIVAQTAAAKFNMSAVSSLGQKVNVGDVVEIERKGNSKKSPIVDKAISKAMVDKIQSEVKSYSKYTNDDYLLVDAKSKFRYLHEVKNCAFTMDNVGASGKISERLVSKFSDDAKPWDQLTESEKQNAIDIILPEIWVPTLIHELGHNLGLRHNFQGSEDKANYYDSNEMAALGIENNSPSSSVMDYVEDLVALPVLGKYDIAALRFAYAKQVENANGELVTVDSTLADLVAVDPDTKAPKNELKEYGFCTDENVGANAGCRRFDLGSSYTEIAQNEIANYYSAYSLRNFRNGAADFSLFNDIGYAQRMSSRFMGLRTMQEVYERIKYRFGIPEDHPIWSTNEFLSDVKTAAQLSGKFLMDVVATPDTTCLVAQKTDPSTVVAILPLEKLDTSLMSCFAWDANPQFVAVGQTGKFFNSKKSDTSTNPYADQIDVRGVWLDKLIAAKVLFQRQLNSTTFDKNGDNYTDRLDMKDLLTNFSKSLVLNQVAGDQEVTLADGSKVVMNIPVDLSSSHIVAKTIHPVISKMIGIPHRDVHFTELFTTEIVKNMTEGIQYQVSGQPLSDAVKVTKLSAVSSTLAPGVEYVDIGADRFVASSQNTIALDVIKKLKIVLVLEKLSREKLFEILSQKFEDPAAKAAETVTDANELAAWNMDFQVLLEFFQGQMDSSENYKALLLLLRP